MAIATLQSVTHDRPLMAEIDVCGLTHKGLVRTTDADAAERSYLKHVLWSALSSTEIVPEVVVTDFTRRGVVLLCTDGGPSTSAHAVAPTT